VFVGGVGAGLGGWRVWLSLEGGPRGQRNLQTQALLYFLHGVGAGARCPVWMVMGRGFEPSEHQPH
jgi:hypothetical protein